MIIIQSNRIFTDAEFEAIDILWRHHSINFPLQNDLGDFMKETLAGIYHAIMHYREPQLVFLRPIMPKLKNFKFNFHPLLKWQKEQRGYKRHAMGFSDSMHSRRAMKKAGLIVGKIEEIIFLAEELREAECHIHSQ